MARSKNRQSLLIDSLKNPKEAKAYLEAVLEACKECDEEEAQKLILLAFKNLTEAQGGVAKLAAKTGLGRESLYKTLSAEGNPRLSTIISLTFALLQPK